jgi:hypothetical protein
MMASRTIAIRLNMNEVPLAVRSERFVYWNGQFGGSDEENGDPGVHVIFELGPVRFFFDIHEREFPDTAFPRMFTLLGEERTMGYSGGITARIPQGEQFRVDRPPAGLAEGSVRAACRVLREQFNVRFVAMVPMPGASLPEQAKSLPSPTDSIVVRPGQERSAFVRSVQAGYQRRFGRHLKAHAVGTPFPERAPPPRLPIDAFC